MLTDFHFLRPWWLLALLPALLFVLLLYKYRREHSPWHTLIANHLQPALLGSQLMLKKQPLALPALFICWLITVLALAGPSWQKLPQPALAVKKATVLILDMSMSMRATDMVPDRLTQQRFAALDFSNQLKEGELALLSFAGDAFVISPLTPDHNNIRLLVPDLTPEIMPAQGSNLLAALTQADKLLRQAGYPRGDVVVFTDGYDNNSLRDIQDLLNNWPHRLSILGFGSEDGAPVKLENGELLKNSAGGVVLPRLPQQQLATLARQSGGVYVQALATTEPVSALLDLPPLSALDQADANKQIQGDQWQDNAVYLVWLLLPLALWLHKRGALTVFVLVLFMPKVEAFEWSDLWQTQQQKAQQAYQQGDYATAEAAYKKLLARKPNDNFTKLGLAQVQLLARTHGVDAAKVMEEAVKNPDDIELQIQCADVEVMSGYLEPAFDRLLRLLVLFDGVFKAVGRYVALAADGLGLLDLL